MRPAYVDVRLELDLNSLTDLPDPTEYIVEMARAEADRLCERSRARLRTDRVPDFEVQRGEHRETGQLCLLVAARWACDIPANVQVR